MSITNKVQYILNKLKGTACQLVAVSKSKPSSNILEVYRTGHKIFGENKIQELCSKYEELPKDIKWHMIGHLQTNKVKYIAPFVHLIHGVDSLKLLKEINRQGHKCGRVINCLLQIHIAQEDTKFGLVKEKLFELIANNDLKDLQNVSINGLMGIATNTENKSQIRNEFKGLKELFVSLKNMRLPENIKLSEISMGMSGDYEIALEEGSTMIRIGSTIFGARDYQMNKTKNLL